MNVSEKIAAARAALATQSCRLPLEFLRILTSRGKRGAAHQRLGINRHPFGLLRDIPLSCCLLPAVHTASAGAEKRSVMSSRTQGTSTRRRFLTIPLALFLLTIPLLSHEPPKPYPTVNAQFEPLRQQFNHDAGKIRLLILLDPT